MFKQTYRHNIALLWASEFLSFFGITSFWLLFLSQHGMTLWQIGVLESIFHGTSLLSEVPSGILADRFSYKTNLYVRRLASILSALLMLVASGNFGFMPWEWLSVLGPIILTRGQALRCFLNQLKRLVLRISICEFLALCQVFQKQLAPLEQF